MRFAYESQWLGGDTISKSLTDIAESLLQFLKHAREVRCFSLNKSITELTNV